MNKLKELENYINNIDIKELSMQELEHYVKILIELENLKADKILKFYS